LAAEEAEQERRREQGQRQGAAPRADSLAPKLLKVRKEWVVQARLGAEECEEGAELDEPGRVRVLGLIYALGVLVSFLLLAGLVLVTPTALPLALGCCGLLVAGALLRVEDRRDVLQDRHDERVAVFQFLQATEQGRAVRGSP
jgi:hypothetical protein